VGIAQLGEDAARAFGEDPAGGGELDRAAVANKKFYAQAAFKVRNLMTDG
jgi:hypothetical protein